MLKIGAIKVLVSPCITGVYLRWWFNGWHYYNFTNDYEISMQTESAGTQVTRYYSVISKIERPTKIQTKYSYKISLEGIPPAEIGGFMGLLMAENVMQYEDGTWREVDITRGEHVLKEEGQPSYQLTFEVTRKELPNSSSVFQKSLKLYLGDVLCDMDDDEIVPVNKQTNDIAEMQDRQSDFTAQFKIRKTRAMRALFELTGEVGSTTTFPYTLQTCKLIQDNIESITRGYLVVDRKDDQYYYVSILSGNKSFFKSIDGLTIKDIDLSDLDHVWNVANMVATHGADLGYVYPLCEPSNDGGIAPLTDDGTRVEMYGGWIRAFVKVKTIFDRIISGAGYTATGNIFTDEIFTKLFIPLSNLEMDYLKLEDYMYNVFVNNSRRMDAADQPLCWGWGCYATVTSYKGNSAWRYGSYYYTTFAADYTFRLTFSSRDNTSFPDHVNMYAGGVLLGEMTGGVFQMRFLNGYPYWSRKYEMTASLLSGWGINWRVSYCLGVQQYSVEVINITAARIAYGSDVPISRHIPDLSQTDFIKMICNMFGLVPDVSAKDKKILFWNYEELYGNIPKARDWSAYLSERDDEVEFKFGDYAQKNYLRYKQADDVIPDNGLGSMVIDDTTLPATKDVVEIPFSTCDEVLILADVFDVNVSRIDFNIFNADTGDYDVNNKIDPRIVYIDHIPECTSPPETKVFGIRPTVAPGGATDVDNPKKASSLEVSFSRLIWNYSSLSRMLTKTELRRAKFNLPVYEVAGLKHYIPIYLSQYKAYFYVNKINNYVPGQLCTIDLIKL